MKKNLPQFSSPEEAALFWENHEVLDYVDPDEFKVIHPTKRRRYVLKLEKDDPKKELEFEVKCALEMSQEDRIHKLLLLSESMLKLAKRHETRRPDRIVKRPIG